MIRGELGEVKLPGDDEITTGKGRICPTSVCSKSDRTPGGGVERKSESQSNDSFSPTAHSSFAFSFTQPQHSNTSIMPHTGQCLCGQTKVSVKSTHEDQIICHCTSSYQVGAAGTAPLHIWPSAATQSSFTISYIER